MSFKSHWIDDSFNFWNLFIYLKPLLKSQYLPGKLWMSPSKNSRKTGIRLNIISFNSLHQLRPQHSAEFLVNIIITNSQHIFFQLPSITWNVLCRAELSFGHQTPTSKYVKYVPKSESRRSLLWQQPEYKVRVLFNGALLDCALQGS